MKLKEIFYGLGLKPATREYTFDIKKFNLEKEGEIDFAVWRHPSEKPKNFTQAGVDALRSFLSKGDFAVDIGAHTGDSTLPIALAVGPTGGVLALEPNPHVYKVLLANTGLNKTKSQIYPLMFAAMPEDGEYEFEYSDSGFCNGGLHKDISTWKHAHFFRLRVQGRNLVAYIKRELPGIFSKIRYVKIDTEGFDPDVAESILELLEKNRPFIKTEIYKHLPAERRITYYRRLRSLGYTVHRWQNDEDYCGQILSDKDMTRWIHFDVFAVPERSAASEST
ncbi:MAG: FkbM family methyltransferase [Gammaproteobacteria bacterium]